MLFLTHREGFRNVPGWKVAVENCIRRGKPDQRDAAESCMARKTACVKVRPRKKALDVFEFAGC